MAFDHSKGNTRRLYFIHGTNPTAEQLEQFGGDYAFRNVDAIQPNDTLEVAAEVAGAWPKEYSAYNAAAEGKGVEPIKLTGKGMAGENEAPAEAKKGGDKKTGK